MKKPFAVLSSVVLTMSLALTGCGGGNSAQTSGGGSQQAGSSDVKQVIRIVDGDEPGTLHPGKAEAMTETQPIEHMMEGLMTKTPEAKIVPGMAKEEPKVSTDGKTYTFTLRDGLKWSNGDPLTAHDFEYAWKYVINPATASPYSYQMMFIQGAEAYNTSKEKDAGKLKKLEDAVGVKALDDKTLEVKLVNPTPFFTDVLTQATFYPVDKKVQEANPKWADDPKTYVSNGPFKLTEWKHKQSMKMVKNENYYDKDKIKLDEIDWAIVQDENTVYQMYRSGQLDVAFPMPAEVTGKLLAAKDPTVIPQPNFGTYYYDINLKSKDPKYKVLQNKKIRKALAMAIDRKTITEKITLGGEKPAYGYVPYGYVEPNGKEFADNTGALFKEDVAEAKKLLAEGMKEEGITAMPPMPILYNTLNRHKNIAEAVQEMWRKNLGLNVTLENVEMKVRLERNHKHDYVMTRDGWNGDYIDPMTFLGQQISTSTQNFSGFNNKQYDDLVKKANEALNPEERLKYMHDAEKILIDEMPLIPIYYYTQPYAVKPNVKGVFCTSNRYPDVMYAEITK